jgi:hypothetical protein
MMMVMFEERSLKSEDVTSGRVTAELEDRLEISTPL